MQQHTSLTSFMSHDVVLLPLTSNDDQHILLLWAEADARDAVLTLLCIRHDWLPTLQVVTPDLHHGQGVPQQRAQQQLLQVVDGGGEPVLDAVISGLRGVVESAGGGVRR
jgi:hypothetical protein